MDASSERRTGGAPPQSAADAASRRGYALALLTLVYAVAFIDRQILAIVQESIKRDLRLSDTELGLLTGFAFSLLFVLAGIPLARLADRWVRRGVIARSIAAWSVMTALTGAASSITMLAAARIGVGIGEAGCSPPSYSIIADLFPPGRRATALSVYSVGGGLGMLFGFLLGGWLNQALGWRLVFLLLGLPGLALALVVHHTLPEPPRGGAAVAMTPRLSARASLALFAAKPTLRPLAGAVALSSWLAYGVINWSAPFFMRVHHMGSAMVGTWLALGFGVAGIIVSLAGGRLSDRLGGHDRRWYLWLPALAAIAMAPLLLCGFLAPDADRALGFLLPVYASCSMFTGMTLSVVNGVVPPHLRATASAFYLLITNLVGLGLGSLVTGWLSDQLAPRYATHSLQMALVFELPAVALAAAFLYGLAARTVARDLHAAEAAEAPAHD
jgi:MFS family permease